MRLPVLFACAALLALLASGCGGAGGDETTIDQGGGGTQPAPSRNDQGGERQGSPGNGGNGGGDGQSESHAQPNPPSHHDSGGGAAQFKVEGADNSVIEYGEEASAAERNTAAGVLHSYLDAHVAGDYGEMCSVLSMKIKDNLGALAEKVARQGGPRLKDCDSVLAALDAKVPQAALVDAAHADVVSLRRNGDRGFLIYQRGSMPYSITLVLESGDWKLDAIEGNELPH